MFTNAPSASFRPSGKREALLNDLFAALDGKAFGQEAEAVLASEDRPRALRAVAAHYRALADEWFGPSASGAPSPKETATAADARRLSP